MPDMEKILNEVPKEMTFVRWKGTKHERSYPVTVDCQWADDTVTLAIKENGKGIRYEIRLAYSEEGDSQNAEKGYDSAVIEGEFIRKERILGELELEIHKWSVPIMVDIVKRFGVKTVEAAAGNFSNYKEPYQKLGFSTWQTDVYKLQLTK